MKKLLLSALAAGLGFAGCEGQDVPAAPEESAVKTAEFDTPWGHLPLSYEERNGRAIHQGDMDLGPVPELGYQPRANVRSSRPFRWPMGIVYFENTLTVGGKDDQRILDAITHWENTSVRFVRSNTARDRVRIVANPSPDEGQSAVGRQEGVQQLSLGANVTAAGVAHEFGHAVGLHHEQSRADRDNFVNIFPTCVKTNRGGNFDKVGIIGKDSGPYDFDSLMHYSSGTFLDPAKKMPDNTPCTATIRRKNGAWIDGGGSLTMGDRDAVHSLYGEHSAERVGGPASLMAVDSMGLLSAVSPDGTTVFRLQRFTTNWTNIGKPGGSGRMRMLIAGGSELFAHNVDTGDIYRYGGGTTWTKVGSNGTTFAVGGDGVLYGVSADARNVTRWSGSGLNWTNLTSPNGQPVSNIYAGGINLPGGSNLFATAASGGDIYKWQGGTSWVKVGGPGHSFAVTADGTLYGLTPDRGAIFRWDGTGTAWTQVGGSAVSIAGGGSFLVATNSLDEVWSLVFNNWHFTNLGPVITPVVTGSVDIFGMAKGNLDVFKVN